MPAGIKGYGQQLIVAFDQLLNVAAGGWADETFSARCWRLKDKNAGWALARRMVDGIFFWQDGHCRSAWENVMNRVYVPGEGKMQ